jgi:hypothetical protein
VSLEMFGFSALYRSQLWLVRKMLLRVILRAV